ncbi:MAG: hypothetical protein ABI652_03435, partial [Acidobacteriota bacterium]
APRPDVYTGAMGGFFPREHDAVWSWRWAGADGTWMVGNTTGQPVVAVLRVELSAFMQQRHVALRIDGRPLQTLEVQVGRAFYAIGPVVLSAGPHELAFQALEPPTLAGAALGNGDPRALSFAVGAWQWLRPEQQP